MQKEKYDIQVSFHKDDSNKAIYDIEITRDQVGCKLTSKRYSELNSFHDEIIKNIKLLKLYCFVILDYKYYYQSFLVGNCLAQLINQTKVLNGEPKKSSSIFKS